MKASDRDVLLDKLLDLMSLHHHASYDVRGLPYVKEDGSFGLTAGEKGGGLYAAYFLMDQLEEGGLLGGGQPGTDLDTAMYTLGPGKVFEVYDGAKLFRDEDNEITVHITTDKPLADIIAALEVGMESARADYRREAKSEIEGRNERKADKQREKMGPIGGYDADDALVTAYLTMRVHQEFPNSNIKVENTGVNPELEKILNDNRPRLRVSFNHPAGENFSRFNDFHSALGKVFNGSCAVSPGMGGGPRNEIDIAGHMARLAADVLEHDAKGARRVVGMLKGTLDEAAVATYTAHIDRFDATKNEIEALTKGAAKPIKVGGTLKIRTQG
jgi:hypothetical protein